MTTLSEAVEQFGNDAYLITIGDEGPHTSFISLIEISPLLRAHISKSATKNIKSNPKVSILWTPVKRGGYSLIVNASATATGRAGQATTPTAMKVEKAVFHRPKEKFAAEESPIETECKRLTFP